jgi:galactitol-specific phosphotransferase system IIB component
MTNKYLIYVCCGSAAASAALARRRLIDELEKRKVKAEVVVQRILELPGQVATRKPDVVVVTAGQAPASLPEEIIVIQGIPLMTGFGIDALVDDMLNQLKAKES